MLQRQRAINHLELLQMVVVTNGKTNGLAIGNFASSESHQSIAIGYYSVANAAEIDPALPATAVGAGAHATGQSTVA